MQSLLRKETAAGPAGKVLQTSLSRLEDDCTSTSTRMTFAAVESVVTALDEQLRNTAVSVQKKKEVSVILTFSYIALALCVRLCLLGLCYFLAH